VKRTAQEKALEREFHNKGVLRRYGRAHNEVVLRSGGKKGAQEEDIGRPKKTILPPKNEARGCRSPGYKWLKNPQEKPQEGFSSIKNESKGPATGKNRGYSATIVTKGQRNRGPGETTGP